MSQESVNASHGLPTPRDLVGVVRRFGPFGPAYIVRGVVREAREGEAVLTICIPETGEEVERTYAEILRDPEED